MWSYVCTLGADEQYQRIRLQWLMTMAISAFRPMMLATAAVYALTAYHGRLRSAGGRRTLWPTNIGRRLAIGERGEMPASMYRFGGL